MTTRERGLYELLVTEALDGELAGLDAARTPTALRALGRDLALFHGLFRRLAALAVPTTEVFASLARHWQAIGAKR